MRTSEKGKNLVDNDAAVWMYMLKVALFVGPQILDFIQRQHKLYFTLTPWHYFLLISRFGNWLGCFESSR